MVIKISVKDQKLIESTDKLSLVVNAKKGDNSSFWVLCKEYYPYIKRLASLLYVKGGEFEDLVQEGLIGLHKAIKNYSPIHGGNFDGFAKKCIKRSMLQIVRSSNAKKELIHHDSVFLFDKTPDERHLIDFLPSNVLDPLSVLIKKEQYKTFINNLKLTDFEHQVFELYLEGLTYKEIAKNLNSSIKSVDNALLRIKRKAKKIFNQKPDIL